MFRHKLYRLDLKASPYLYVAPFFILFLTIGMFPLIYTAWVSMQYYKLDEDESTRHWVGFDNYAHLLKDEYFWNAFSNTLQILVLSSVPQLLMAIGLAHVLNMRLRGSTFWRMSVLLPNITSVVAVAIIFGQLFGRDFGLINWFLSLFDLGKIDWRAGEGSSVFAIATMINWRWTGYNALIYLAAMQAVPKDLYDAASLDGATSFQQLRKITIPAIRPTVIFTVIVSTIGGMQVLAEPLVFGVGSKTGGEDRQFQTIALYLYELGFGRFNFGYASAAAWMMFVIILLAAGVNYLLTSRMKRS